MPLYIKVSLTLFVVVFLVAFLLVLFVLDFLSFLVLFLSFLVFALLSDLTAFFFLTVFPVIEATPDEASQVYVSPNVFATYLVGTYISLVLSLNSTILGSTGRVSLLPFTFAVIEFNVNTKVVLSLFNSKVFFVLLYL